MVPSTLILNFRTNRNVQNKGKFKSLILEPKQFKNNLIMLEDKPQFEFAAS